MLGVGVFVSCSDDDVEIEEFIDGTDIVGGITKTLTGISVNDDEIKTTFATGTKFDATGLVVTRHYSNNIADDVDDSPVVTLSYTNSGGEKVELKSGETVIDTNPGTYDVTVTYDWEDYYETKVTKSTTYQIEVKVVTKVEFTGNVYTYSSSTLALVTSGSKITVTYGEDETEVIAYGSTKWNDVEFSAVSSNSCTATYLGKESEAITTENKTSVGDLLEAGVSAGDLLATGKDLYNTTNTTADWLGSDSTGYLLNVGKVAATTYITDDATYGKVIDAHAAQSTTTAPDVSGAKVTATNPLSGTSATSVTLYARVKNAASQNGFDTLLGFCKSGSAWSYCGIYESGGVHANSSGYFDNVDNLWTDTEWHTVVVVMNATTYSLYIDGTAKATDTAISGDNIADWANTYWSATADTFSVGPGLTWAAGYVDEGAYISDVALFPKALTAAEVAAMEVKD